MLEPETLWMSYGTYECIIKQHMEDHAHGIDGGRISYLKISLSGQTLASYNNTWELEVTDEGTRKAYNFLINEYNE